MRHATRHPTAEPVTEVGTERDPVEELAEEFLERRRQGSNVTVTEYEGKYPHWSQRIRELFSTLLLVEELKTVRPKSASGASGSDPPCLSEDNVTRLGDFHIIREIGRGGMGVVYEAEQESLGRRVALKVVSSRSLGSAKTIERFRREARAAARLHHTNIVPVFGVGEENGKHYYVMQYIEGCSLDCLLNELTAGSQLTTVGPRHNGDNAIDRSGEGLAEPRSSLRLGRSLALPAGQDSDQNRLGLGPASVRTESQPTGDERRDATEDGANKLSAALAADGTYWRTVADIASQAADALQYAHGAGVLHRDIKPGNLLLDQMGVVWITDFGLAKVVEQDDMTRTGDLVGTLRYMAPEQMDREADARSDVYALGLTLYELVTRRPAFDETSRHRLMKQVFQHDPPPPRSVNQEIPRDLETVILKAIARDPAHRYQTAGGMRDDLHRFLQDQPVTARRVTVIERFWRWCRRNPLPAGLASTVFALLIGITLVALIGAHRVGRALDGETRQRERAETTSALAFQVLDRIYYQLAPDRVTDNSEQALRDSDGQELDLPHQPVVSKETAALLENLLEFYDRLALQAGDDPQLLRRVADANRRVGDIQARLGNHDQARDALLRSVNLYEALANQSPADTQVSAEIARVYNELGCVYGAMRRMDEARAAHQDALELLGSPIGDTTNSRHCFELARTHYFLGVRQGPTFGGPKSGSAPPGPSPPNGTTNWGREPPKLGPPGFRGGPLRRGPSSPGPRWDWGDRQRHLQQAVALLEGLLEQSPTAPEYRHLLAQCFRAWPAPPFAPRNDGDRSGTLRQATQILEQLVEDFPDVADYRYDLCAVYARSGFWWGGSQREDLGATEERLQLALDMSGRLVAEHPHVPDYTELRTQILSQHAEAMRWKGRRIEAEAGFRDALAIQSSLVEQFPEVARFKLSQTRLQKSLAEVLRGQRKHAESRSLLEQSIAILQDLSDHDTAGPFARMSTSPHYAALADVLSDMGEKEAAAEARSHVIRFRGPRPFGPQIRRNTHSTPDPGRAKATHSGDREQPVSDQATP
jgi:tetratricopeptide (TPR) repeat protein/tRNA A-37 threonylcarbamoyl transferase component Bud32